MENDLADEQIKTLNESDIFNAIHIVLVEPANSLNIGSVARAMANLGFSNLHVVAPFRYDRKKAAATACAATALLDQALFHDRLEDVLQSMEEVVGFSNRHGRNRPGHLLLPDWSARITPGEIIKTALLFGPEDTGLRQDHIEHCRWLIRIPSNEDVPSYNLAQAVLLTLFELSHPHWKQELPDLEQQLPTWNEFYQLDRILEEVLIRSGFYRKGTPATIPGMIKNIFRRLRPNLREMKILLALFAKVNHTLAGESPVRELAREQSERDRSNQNHTPLGLVQK